MYLHPPLYRRPSYYPGHIDVTHVHRTKGGGYVTLLPRSSARLVRRSSLSVRVKPRENQTEKTRETHSTSTRAPIPSGQTRLVSRPSVITARDIIKPVVADNARTPHSILLYAAPTSRAWVIKPFIEPVATATRGQNTDTVVGSHYQWNRSNSAAIRIESLLSFHGP